MPGGELPADDRPDGVDDEAAREVPRLGHPGVARRECVAAHDRVAFVAQLEARGGMDRVVDAVVEGREAAEHRGVRGVDDPVDFEAGDVPAPDRQPSLGLGDEGARRVLLAQEFILEGEPFGGERAGCADVHEGAQREARRVEWCAELLDAGRFGGLVEESLDESADARVGVSARHRSAAPFFRFPGSGRRRGSRPAAAPGRGVQAQRSERCSRTCPPSSTRSAIAMA